MRRKQNRVLLRTAALLLVTALMFFSVPSASLAYAAESGGIPSGAAPSSITISDAKYPAGALSLGLAFSIKGVISSNYALVKVWGGVYKTDGTRTALYREVGVNTKSYDIKKGFDAYLKFASLQVGDYVFKIQATDNKGYTATVIDSPFTVRDNGTVPSEIVLTEGSVPADTVPTGSVFNMYGLVTSSYPLSKVWGGVYKEDGTATSQYLETAPNASTYTLNKSLNLGSLAEGNYIYRLSAKDVRGFTKIIAEKNFVLSSDSAVPSDITVYGASYPTGVLKRGSGFSIKGVVYSTYNISRVIVGVYYDGGAPTDIIFEKAPNAKTFNLSAFDSLMTFGKLSEGEYIYRVEAIDNKGYLKTLVNSGFTVKSAEISGSSTPIVMKGIDVSSFQNSIDWTKVAAAGIDFAIIRAATTNNSDANYMEDRFFTANYTMARSAGIKLGAYIYTSAANKSEMKYNIECLLRTLDGRDFDMPIYIDVEAGTRQSGLGKTALTEIIRYGCSLIREAGYDAGVYASLEWYKNYIDSEVLNAENNEIWLAVWPSDPSKLDYSQFCVTWQYRSDGTIDGIEGVIDMDYRYKGLPSASYTITVENTENGTVTASAASAQSGTKVTLTVTPAKGYTVKSVKYGDLEASAEGGGKYSFTMPSRNITVTARFEHIIGDINEDGYVNGKDLARMMRYLSGENVAVAAEALDVDGNETVDARDLVRLMSIISY